MLSWLGTGTLMKCCELKILSINIIYKNCGLLFFYLSCELFELNKYIRRQNICLYYYLSIIIWPFLTVWYFNLSHLQQEYYIKTFHNYHLYYSPGDLVLRLAIWQRVCIIKGRQIKVKQENVFINVRLTTQHITMKEMH